MSLFLLMRWPGAEVLRVWDGTSAVEAFAEEDPDLVILDLSLPDVSGYAVLDRFRVASSVPIIVPSFGDDAEEKARALGAGANDYMSKPCVGAVFLARVQALLRRPRLAPSPQQRAARMLATHTPLKGSISRLRRSFSWIDADGQSGRG